MIKLRIINKRELTNVLLFMLSELILLICIEFSFAYYIQGSTLAMIISYAVIITYSLVIPLVFSILTHKNHLEEHTKNQILIFILYMTSATLILVTSFAQSPYDIFGYDINQELFFANKVIEEHYWNVKVRNSYNSVLSITLLAPIISLITNLSNLIILKLIYPLLFCFIFIFLYKISNSRMNSVMSYFSTLFFIYLFTNFTEMLALGRQMIAEVLLVITLFSIIYRGEHKNLITYMILLLGLALSHYSTAFVFSYVLITGLVFKKLLSLLGFKFDEAVINKGKHGLSLLTLIFVIVNYLWYISIAGGVSFLNLLGVFKAVLIYLDKIFNSIYSQASSAIIMPTTLGRSISRFILLSGLAFITIGVLAEAYSIRKNKVHGIWAYYFRQFALPFFLLNALSFAVPFLSNALNATRIYQLSLIVLFPYFYVGWEFLSNLFSNSNNLIQRKKVNEHTNTIQIQSRSFLVFFVVLYLSIYAIADTGILILLLKDPQPPQWLNPVANPSWKLPEISAVEWIASNIKENTNIVVTTYEFNFPLLLRYNVTVRVINDESINSLQVKDVTVIYFSGRSTEYYGVYPLLKYYGSAPYVDLVPALRFRPFIVILGSSRIYSSNLSAVYLLR